MKKDCSPAPALWALHVAALSVFAFAQPLYDLLGREPAFFVAHDTGPLALVLFALVLVLAPAAVLWTLSVLPGLLGERAASGSRFLIVTLLAALTLLPPIHRGGIAGGVAAVLLAALAASAFGVLYLRFASLRSFVSVLSLAVVVSPGLFLFSSPASRLLRPAEELASTVPVGSTVPVVMVVFDELPLSSLLDADAQVDTKRYPGFADMAQHGTWYRRATTVSAFTHFALPAILTGNYPQPGRYATLEDQPRNLFTWLGGSYELQVVEPVTRLCPDELISDRSWRPDAWESWRTLLVDSAVIYSHIVVPPRLSGGLKDITLKWKGFAEDGVDPRRDVLAGGHSGSHLERLLTMIDSDDALDSTLYFVHLLVPHFPWRRLPSGKEYGPIGAMAPHAFDPERFGQWGHDEWLIEQAYQQHLLQVGYADRLLVELLDKLRQKDLYDKALIVVTADHGFNFKPGAGVRSTDRDDLLQDEMAVPLFIKRPGQQAGKVNELPVESIDILPTIAAEIGAQLPWPVDGLPANHPALPERRWKTLAEGGHGRPVEIRTIEFEKLAGRRTLDYKLSLFGSGEDDIFDIGPHRDLLGQSAGPLVGPLNGQPPLNVRLVDAWTYDDVDLDGRFIPANVSGTITGEQLSENGAAHEVAIAVNGRIRATTRTFVSRGEVRFAAMVPESSFQAGRNEVDVFVVEGKAANRRLIPTRHADGARREMRLVATEDGDVVRTADGADLPLAPERIRGSAQANAVFLYGWAADLQNPDQAVEVVVFYDERPVVQARADIFLPVIQADPTLGLKKEVHYQVTVPFSMLPEGAAIPDLRVFALAEDAAAELHLDFEEQFKVPAKKE